MVGARRSVRAALLTSVDNVWHILALIGLDLLLLIGWIAIPLGLSGNFILLGAALLTAIVTRFEAVGWIALIAMAAADQARQQGWSLSAGLGGSGLAITC